jgi:hypothetical protein
MLTRPQKIRDKSVVSSVNRISFLFPLPLSLLFSPWQNFHSRKLVLTKKGGRMLCWHPAAGALGCLHVA